MSRCSTDFLGAIDWELKCSNSAYKKFSLIHRYIAQSQKTQIISNEYNSGRSDHSTEGK